MKKRKSLSLSALEKKLDKEFSDYIRRKDADEGGTVTCVTCGKLMFWKSSAPRANDGGQCGHYIKRQHRGTRYDERNCHVQCARCNAMLGGNDTEYTIYIIDKFGREVCDELRSWKHKEKKFYRTDLEEMIEKYKALNRELDKRLPRKT